MQVGFHRKPALRQGLVCGVFLRKCSWEQHLRKERKGAELEEGEYEMGHSPRMAFASQRWNGFSKSAKLRVSGWAFIRLANRSLDVGCPGREVTLQPRPSLKGAYGQGLSVGRLPAAGTPSPSFLPEELSGWHMTEFTTEAPQNVSSCLVLSILGLPGPTSCLLYLLSPGL